ncbi:MAG: DUF938 domain-containing protein [Burkholderiales bacterium]|nr:DUF938 domain-containing protein [Burkholderiales bacterium]
MNPEKRHSPACERNREPIFTVLQTVFAQRQQVLEIGSGTGQHAVYFGPDLPHLRWHTSDLAASHPSILAWQQEFPAPNVLPPVLLDCSEAEWPLALAGQGIDAIYSANTCHIMPWPCVQNLLRGASRLLPAGGLLAIYGPFNIDGQFTSASNAEFDAMLQARGVGSGLRDKGDMLACAGEAGLTFVQDYEMPANNRLLLWRKAG